MRGATVQEGCCVVAVGYVDRAEHTILFISNIIITTHITDSYLIPLVHISEYIRVIDKLYSDNMLPPLSYIGTLSCHHL